MRNVMNLSAIGWAAFGLACLGPLASRANAATQPRTVRPAVCQAWESEYAKLEGAAPSEKLYSLFPLVEDEYARMESPPKDADKGRDAPRSRVFAQTLDRNALTFAEDAHPLAIRAEEGPRHEL